MYDCRIAKIYIILVYKDHCSTIIIIIIYGIYIVSNCVYKWTTHL